jgi:hypothetical protein
VGIVANILDAIRRRGRPTQQSALRRLDEQLEGRVVLDRGHTIARSELGAAEQFTAAIEPVNETVRVLPEDEVRTIETNARLAFAFATTFGVHPAGEMTLDDLDSAYASWLQSDDKRGYDSREVVQLLGAAFGEYCVSTLAMRWVTIEDAYGAAIGVQGRETDFRGFPYHSVEKRIESGEYGFFRTVYIGLQDAANRGYRSTATP